MHQVFSISKQMVIPGENLYPASEWKLVIMCGHMRARTRFSVIIFRSCWSITVSLSGGVTASLSCLHHLSPRSCSTVPVVCGFDIEEASGKGTPCRPTSSFWQ
jgi:hypothetical protein